MNASRSALLAGLSLVALGAALATSAQAQAPAPAAAAAAPANDAVEAIVVTGTRVAGRTRLDTIAPVDVVTASNLQHTGSTELAQNLSVALPSVNFPRPTLTDGTDSVRPATLRGLAPDQVLVLVNSKRRQTSALVNLNGSVGRGSAAVDLNTIPSQAISTVEVLRDGASAQYGSDAIAGVVNLRLKEANHGGGVSVEYGEYDTNVKTTPQALPAGATWTVQPNYHRNDGATKTVSGWTGLDLGKGFLTLSGEYKDQDHTVRAAPDTRPQYALVNGQYDPRENTFNRVDEWWGDPDMSQYTGFANAGYDLNDNVHLYGWASYQNRNSTSGGTFRRSCSAGPSCPTSLTGSSANSSIQNTLSIYPDGFLPKINPTIEDASAAGGATFKAGGWDFDASLVWGMNKVHYHVIDSLNAEFGAGSPSSFDAGALRYDQTVANIGAVKQYDVGLAKPINVALGAEYRNEGYKITAGEPASYANIGAFTDPRATVTKVGTVPVGPGAQVFSGFTPGNATDQSRDSYAGYLDIDLKPVEQLDIDGALRGEHYSDFGGVITGKLAARFDFTPNFAVRGAISNGFRAPSLQQTAFTGTSITFINNVPFQIQTLPPTDPVAKALGSTPLKPEKSDNYSGGIVARLAGFALTVDGYYIKVNNRIVLSENITTAPASLLPVGVSGARFFTNGVDTRTKGVEAVLTYRWQPAWDIGRFDLTLSGSHNETDITRGANVPVTLASGTYTLFGRVNSLVFEEGQPKWKGAFSTDWTDGKLGVTARATYYGPVVSPGTTAANDVYLGNHTLVDLEARYNPVEAVQLAVGVNNLFDSYPAPTPNSTGGSFSSYSPFGFDGRFLYARASYSW